MPQEALLEGGGGRMELLRAGSGVVIPQIVLGDRWGDKSWFVHTNVKFNESRGRPPHVELRAGRDAPQPGGIIGARYALTNLRRYRRNGAITPAVVWDVVGLCVAGARPPRLAHLTVHYGWEHEPTDYAS